MVTNAKVGQQTHAFDAQSVEAQASAAELCKTRGHEQNLVTTVHHDLSEPLRSIVSFTQLIRRGLSKQSSAPDVDKYLAFARDGG